MTKVNFVANHEDMTVAVLGSLGFSTEYIKKTTGLSTGQVIYRLGKAKIKRYNYRNGQSPIAHFVVRNVRKTAVAQVRKHL